jgi:preprotein translocase subunit SecB
MTPSALTLERAFFTKIEITASLDAAAKPTPTFETSVSAGADPANPRRFQVTVSVKLIPETGTPAAYSGNLEAQAFFSVVEAVPTEHVERLAVVHGSTLLFGMLREMLCTVTARGPWPMYVLPTASFADLVPPPKLASD